MAPSRGGDLRRRLLDDFLILFMMLIFIESGIAGRNRTKQSDQKKDQQVKSTTESLVDPNEKWDPTAPFPRSKALLIAYLEMHEVVPNIIPTAPRAAVEVVYANSIAVDFGNELWPHQVNAMPHRTVWPVEKKAYYTIVLFTPDYPTRACPYESHYVYWFVANVFDTCVTATGTTVVEYLTPTVEGNDTGDHRFIFFVYKQPEEIMPYHLPYIPVDDFSECRKFFNITQLAAEHGLGLPVAANLFQMATVKPKKKVIKKKPKEKYIEV